MNQNCDIPDMIYRKYASELYAYGISCYKNKSMVEDAMHDVFLDVCRHQETFLAARNRKQYLLSALHHRLMRLAQREHEQLDGLTSGVDNLPDNDDVEAFLIRREDDDQRKQMADRLLSSLTPNQREVVRLRVYERKTFEEVAQLLQINCQSAQNLFQRSMDRLRSAMPQGAKMFFLLLCS
jgi:RNA polymerase sigma factor (sigma-70 family)